MLIRIVRFWPLHKTRADVTGNQDSRWLPSCRVDDTVSPEFVCIGFSTIAFKMHLVPGGALFPVDTNPAHLWHRGALNRN
jgi:hypothetical protein